MKTLYTSPIDGGQVRKIVLNRSGYKLITLKGGKKVAECSDMEEVLAYATRQSVQYLMNRPGLKVFMTSVPEKDLIYYIDAVDAEEAALFLQKFEKVAMPIEKIYEATTDVFMIYTAQEAAAAWGVNRVVIQNDISAGKFFPGETRKTTGPHILTHAGLLRVYGPKMEVVKTVCLKEQ